MRKSPGGEIIASLNKGTKVTITGNYIGNNSRQSQFVWFPVRTSSGQTGYVASSYLSPKDHFIDVYNLYGSSRYDTSVSIANHGWHWTQPKSVIIGRGDLPIDALTGSVLASSLDAPLLLTRSNSLVASVEQEIDRLKPEKIYILGGKMAISEEVERILAAKLPKGEIIRISKAGSRYDTAYEVAKRVLSLTKSKEIFITTGDENSSDALAIAPYAGSKGFPILFTRQNSLDPNIIKLIREHSIKKATIIGGNLAVSSKVEKELKKHLPTVERVSGKSRFATSTEIVKRYYGEGQRVNASRLFITQGFEIADALSVSSLAARLKSPLLLTRTEAIPGEIKQWLPENILTKPNLYFIGGRLAISDPVREEFIELISGF